MPSEDAKPVKDEGGDDQKILSSLLENRKKKLVNSNANSTAKSSAKVAKVKKEEPQEYDSDKPIKARPKEAKVKKDNNGDDDDEDEKPLARRNSAVKPDKVLWLYFAF